MQRLTIAVIGCGIAAQTRHVPALTRLTDRFEVTVLCDVDPNALRQAAPWSPNAAHASSTRELFARPELFDAVLIATGGDHIAETAAAARAGKHIFVEKPLALTAEQAEPLVQQIDAAGVACMVGYMKRYSPAVVKALRQLQADPALRIARCDLVHPPEDNYLRSVLGRTRPHSGSLLEFVRRQVTDGDSAASIERTLGADAPMAARIGHFLLTTSVIHDINLLRAALGTLRVVNACFWDGGLSGQAALRNPTGVTAVLTYAFVQAGRYTETLSLVGDTTRLAVSFPSPYLVHAPVRLRVETPEEGENPDRHTEELFYDDVFGLELVAFHEQVTGNQPAHRSPHDALGDLELVAAIAAAGAQSERDRIKYTTKGSSCAGVCRSD